VTLRDAPAWRVVQVLLWALAGAGLGAWLAARGAAAWAAGLAPVGAVLVGGAAAAIGWRLGRPQAVQVRWSGQRWERRAQDRWHPATVQAMLDLGGWLLLRVRPQGGRSCWIGLAQADLGPPGHLLRAALYCPACVDPGRADEDRARS
jgi:hypothetical protein